MENKIKLLPEIVANQIAAGEVVDNPSSVVKEMMENAIDAGAKSVKVNFRNAGLELIQIIDDGCGMSPMDARLAFDRHATSKIAEFDDIYRLSTFGFRGEALASIAAVAEVELRTRRAEDEVGSLTVVNGGEFVSQIPTMCSVGSQFMVRNLFYTAPARRKFSKDRTRMVGDIKKEFRRVALCNPAVGFELLSNDMPIMSLPATTLSERIIDVVGRHIKTNLLEVESDTSIVKIKGYIGRPAAAKQKNSEQYLFVNGRYFRSPQIYHSILRAYEKLIPEGATPSYFIYLTVEADRVDVNVSPHKTEVRFADNDDINQIINASVRSTLAKCGGMSLMDFDNDVAIEIPAMDSRVKIYSEPKSSSRGGYNPFNEEYPDVPMDGDVDLSAYDVPYSGVGDVVASMPKSASQRSPVAGLKEVPWSAMPAEGDFGLSAESQPVESYREIRSSVIGADVSVLDYHKESEPLQQEILSDERLFVESVISMGNGYAVAKCAGRLMVVDLRRAKERISYDGLVGMLNSGHSVSQQLLFPERLTFSEEEYSLLADNHEEFVALGFEFSLLGNGEVELSGIPSGSVGESADNLLYELLREIASSGCVGERMRENMLRMLSRRNSSRMNGCTDEQAKALLGQLFESENYSFSPSGKAIMAEITPEFIKSKLG